MYAYHVWFRTPTVWLNCSYSTCATIENDAFWTVCSRTLHIHVTWRPWNLRQPLSHRLHDTTSSSSSSQSHLIASCSHMPGSRPEIFTNHSDRSWLATISRTNNNLISPPYQRQSNHYPTS